MDNMSLADIAAVTRNNEGFGDGNGWWIILILLFALGGNGFYGNRGYDARCATVEDLNNSANFTRLENQVANNGTMIQNGFRNVDNAVCTLGYQNLEQTKELSAQIADCCCKTQTAIHAEGEATRALIQQNKIEALQQKVSALELQAALCGVVRYPTSTVYTSGANPFCNTGCGCNGYNI